MSNLPKTTKYQLVRNTIADLILINNISFWYTGYTGMFIKYTTNPYVHLFGIYTKLEFNTLFL